MGGSSANRVTAAAADSIGGTGGTETHTLTVSEMPSHSHNLRNGGTGFFASGAIGDPNTGSGVAVSNTGGGGAHNNMQPYMALNFIIRT